MRAREIAAKVARGECTAIDTTVAALARVRARGPAVQAFLRVSEDLALRSAEGIDRRRAAGAPLGPLAGVPMAIKDNLVLAGVETTAGSRILEGWVPPYTGTALARALAADAVPVGKTTMDEFGMGSSNENSPHPAPRNPWDRTRVTGGSSGGSAAAVADRQVAVALGSDTGGSVRQPASLCGVTGLVPTYGRVSRHGLVAFASSLDRVGPIATDVRDTALVLQAIAGPDAHDATALDVPVPDYLAACAEGCAGRSIGVHRAALDHEGLDPEVRSAFTHALEVLSAAGAVIVDVDLPHFDHAVATYYVLCMAEAASNLARYDGLRYGRRVERPSLRETYEATRDEGFGDEVQLRILLGTYVLRKDSYDEYYGRAQRVRSLVARDFARAFDRCDVVACPTSPVPAFPLGARTRDPLAMYLADVFTVGPSLAGLPAISIPAGFTANGLPIGLQLVAPALAEPVLFAVAAAHEDATDWHHRSPPQQELA